MELMGLNVDIAASPRLASVPNHPNAKQHNFQNELTDTDY